MFPALLQLIASPLILPNESSPVQLVCCLNMESSHCGCMACRCAAATALEHGQLLPLHGTCEDPLAACHSCAILQDSDRQLCLLRQRAINSWPRHLPGWAPAWQRQDERKHA